MAHARILISGLGIAGATFAHFAIRAGFSCVIVEKASSLRATGQNIDVNSPAGRDIVRKMGIWDNFMEGGTGELGMLIVDEKMRTWARLPASERAFSLTAQPEIPRGTLAKILYEATPKSANAEWIFGDHVSSIEERGTHIHVTFDKGAPRSFDLVVAADSIYSGVRKMALQDGHRCVVPLNQYMAYFSYPNAGGKIGSDMWGRWYNAKRRRQIILRPSNRGITHASVAVMPPKGDMTFSKSHLMSTDEQKQAMAAYYDDAEGPAPEAINEMIKADDFYLGIIGQVRLDRYYSGRVAFVGDAAYCPSPYTGMGTSLAIIGAYVLAGELMRAAQHQSGDGKALDPRPALESYDILMRPFIENILKLPFGLPELVNPETAWGCTTLRSVAAMLAGLRNVLGWFRGEEVDEHLALPDYQWPTLALSKEDTREAA